MDVHARLLFPVLMLSLGAGAVACTGGSGIAKLADASTCPTGSAQCACYGNDTCDQGLVCVSNVCLSEEGGAGGASASGGGGSGDGGAASASGSGSATANAGGTGGATGGDAGEPTGTDGSASGTGTNGAGTTEGAGTTSGTSTTGSSATTASGSTGSSATAASGSTGAGTTTGGGSSTGGASSTGSADAGPTMLTVFYSRADLTPPSTMSSGIDAEIAPGLAGGPDVTLKHVTLRYWFDEPSGSDMIVECDYWGIQMLSNCGIVTKVVAVSPAKPGASYYAEIAFGDAVANVPVSSVGDSANNLMRLRIHHPTYDAVNPTDDYSYDATVAGIQPNPHITAYVDGVLAWGQPP